MREDGRRSEEWAELASRGVRWLAVAIRDAQTRGEVATGCDAEGVAHFLVASLEGAKLLSKVTRDATVMEQCMSELERYLALYEVRS